MVGKHKVKSLKHKIVLQYVLVIFLTLALLLGTFFVFVHSFYYSGIKGTIESHIKVSSTFLDRYFTRNYFSINNTASFVRDNLEYEGAELQVLDTNNKVITSTSGFNNETIINTPEIDKAVQTKKLETWVGLSNNSNEKIMALSYPLEYKEKHILTVRYLVSLTEVDSILKGLYINVILLGTGILIIVFGISLAFTRSILNPIKKITTASNKMAKGNFDIKLNEDYDGEVGELAQTINYMASEMQKTEKIQHEFISSVSHELRTPLTSIKGWSETMLIGNAPDTEEAKLAFQVISQESDRLIGLVEELLDFSRFHSNDIRLSKTPISLSNTIYAVVSQIKVKASKKNITIETEITANPIILVDENRIKQVLINIIHNAIKYSPAHSTIFIYTKETEDTFFIFIKDSGIGISTNNLEKVRKLFYQEDPKKDGMGVGLTIAQQIMNLHHGQLIIDSEVGKGTTVTILLPK